jgi:hypothetical protein
VNPSVAKRREEAIAFVTGYDFTGTELLSSETRLAAK